MSTVRGENFILSFVFTLLSIRVLCVCCFLILFSFHLGGGQSAVFNGLEKETGGEKYSPALGFPFAFLRP